MKIRVKTTSSYYLLMTLLLPALALSACGQLFKKTQSRQRTDQGLAEKLGPATAISLKWEPPAEASDLRGYNIYVVPEYVENDENSKLTDQPTFITTLEVSGDDFDPKEPAIKLVVADSPELEELIGQKVCFTVTAVNAGKQQSAPSSKACAKL